METWNETDEWADRYVRGDLSGEDRVALIKWLEASPEHLRQFRKILQTEMRVSAAGKWRRLDRTQERVWERITPALVNRKERLYLWGMRIVAIIIVLIGVFFCMANPTGADRKVYSGCGSSKDRVRFAEGHSGDECGGTD